MAHSAVFGGVNVELYVLDKNLNLLGILEGFFSLRWVRRYSKCGEFELHCRLTSDTISLLQTGNVVWKNDDEEAGIIEYRNISLNSQKEETLIIKGRFATSLLGRRIIWGTEIINDTAEVAIRMLINNHAINPSNADRIIPFLELGELKGFTQEISKQTSYTNLLDTVEEIALTSELGFKTKLDVVNKKFIFDIYEGLNRTVGQTINAPAIFAPEFENILEQEYTDSINNYRNVALVGGIGEGTERKLVTVGSGAGLDRFEIFVDQKNLSNEVDGVTMTDDEYEALLTQKGLEILAEKAENRTFDSQVNLNSNLVYRQDFDLGDIVTCTSKKWGVTIDTRITEIEEVYDTNGNSINVTFGNSVPTLIDKIKQVVR